MNSLKGLVKAGDKVLCTESKGRNFTKGKRYDIVLDTRSITATNRTGVSIWCNQNKPINAFDGLKSKFNVVNTATTTVINGTKGDKIMRNVAKVNGRLVVTEGFNLAGLKAGMQIFDTDLGRFDTVIAVTSKGFKTFDKTYDADNLGMLMPTQETERKLADSFSRKAFVAGVKNYYVSFDSDAGHYKRYSEDKIRRIDTVFMSKDDAWTLRGKLNDMMTPKVTQMRRLADDLVIQEMEREIADKYSRVAFTAGVKNYYVSFDADAGHYKRYSEDKIRRIDTVFLTKDDAWSLRRELNDMIGSTK